jgi:hypothetical protein
MKTKKLVPQNPTVGLVLEGTTEYNAIPLLLQRLGVRTVAPSVFNGQPVQASIRSLVQNRLIRHVRTQLVKATGSVLVILDRESRPQSASKFGETVLTEMIRQVKRLDGEDASKRIAVVVADRSFENWLLADPEGLARSKLFRRNTRIVGQVACHADEKNAKELLQGSMAKGWYERSLHGPQLAKHPRVGEAGIKYCSASFLSFLAIIKNL